jgi:hypothetical protein
VAGFAGLPQALRSSLVLPGLQSYGTNHHSVLLHFVHFLVLLARDQVSCSVGCGFDAAGLDSAHVVLCFPVVGALLQQLLPPDVFGALPGVSEFLLAVAQLLHDERVVLPSLSVPRPTRMSWDRQRMLVCSPRVLLDIVIVKRRNSCIAELPVLLGWKQGVHQLNGMRRRRIRFAPRKSALVSEGCSMIVCFISYPQQSLRPHYSIKRVICTMRSISQEDMDNNSLLPFNSTRRNLASGEPADLTLQQAATTSSP